MCHWKDIQLCGDVYHIFSRFRIRSEKVVGRNSGVHLRTETLDKKLFFLDKALVGPYRNFCRLTKIVVCVRGINSRGRGSAKF